MTGRSCNWAAWVFAALLAAAFVLRALPVGYGLPYTYYADEPKVITRSLALAQSGMEPNQYIYPPLFMYLYMAEYAVLYLVGSLCGVFAGPGDIALLYYRRQDCLLPPGPDNCGAVRYCDSRRYEVLGGPSLRWCSWVGCGSHCCGVARACNLLFTSGTRCTGGIHLCSGDCRSLPRREEANAHDLCGCGRPDRA